MKVLVIGAGGQLGSSICEVFADARVFRAEPDSEEILIDVTDAEGMREAIVERVRPDVVVNTAAAHDVVRCENNPAWAFAVNASGAMNVAKACAQIEARLLHVSTDYVFGDGVAGRPFTESDSPIPLSVYGASKFAGECLIAAYCPNYCVVRTAGLYGLAPCKGKSGENFVRKMLAGADKELRVVDDEFTTPTYTLALARQMRVLAEKGAPGVYHATCQGECSWFEFAETIFLESGVSAHVTPVARDCFPSAVKRPRRSVLDNRRLREQGLDIMPHWRDALREYLRALRGGNMA
jgi:dTDP-4-dehydrorhamnose reductase